LAARTAALSEQERQLEQIGQRLSACRIVAGRDGMVVYGPPPSPGETGLEPGAAVRERQLLGKIADPGKFRLRVLVNESRISRLRLGQAATIRFEALPERALAGQVTNVAIAPEPASWATSKEYAVLVSLDDPPSELRFGMTAVVEIQTGAPEDR
jgi:multidrug resistance efflux pump